MLGSTDTNPFGVRIGGTEVSYYLICPAKLWFFSHGMPMERNSGRVDLGRLLHEESYKSVGSRELDIDSLLVLDFDDSDLTIHEVKSSKAFEKAHVYQLAYYLYYLKGKGVQGLKGELNYPKTRRTEAVELTDEIEEELKRILVGIADIKRSDTCPVREKTGKCRKCSYYDFCWG